MNNWKLSFANLRERGLISSKHIHRPKVLQNIFLALGKRNTSYRVRRQVAQTLAAVGGVVYQGRKRARYRCHY